MMPSPSLSFQTLPLITPVSGVPPMRLTTTGEPTEYEPLAPFLSRALPSSRHSAPLTQLRVRKFRFVEPVELLSDVTVKLASPTFQLWLAPATLPLALSVSVRAKKKLVALELSLLPTSRSPSPSRSV